MRLTWELDEYLADLLDGNLTLAATATSEMLRDVLAHARAAAPVVPTTDDAEPVARDSQ